MKYDGIFAPEDMEMLKDMKYRIDIFFKTKGMETYLFKTYEEMICFIAKWKYIFEVMFILKKVDTLYRPAYEVANCIYWNNF